MRRPIGAAVLVAGALLPACGTPRQRDCRELMPLVAEVDAVLVPPALPDAATSPFVLDAVADRYAGLSAKVGAWTARDASLKPSVHALADALDHAAEASKGVHDSIGALHLDIDFRQWAPEHRPPPFDAVAPLFERCFVPFQLSTKPAPECAPLSSALDSCRSPPADTSAAAALDACTARVARIHSADAPTEAALGALVAVLTWLHPLAEHIRVPAPDAVNQLTTAVHAAADLRAAEDEVRTDAQSLRDRCAGKPPAEAGR
jgi:hypothetical protein